MQSLALPKPDTNPQADAQQGENPLAPIWRKITVFNPVVSLLGGVRGMFGIADGNAALGLTMTVALLALCMAAAWWAFRAVSRQNS
jgi:ABC-type polysaccharide/polyol phosphate export permease